MVSLGAKVTRALFSNMRGRLTILVLISLLPPLGLILVNDIGRREAAVQAAQNESLLLARQVAFEQQSLIAETRQLLAVLVKLPQVRGDSVDACNALLENLLAENVNYANLGVIAPNGTVLCSGLPFDEPVNLVDRAYFQEAILNRDFATGDYQIGRITSVASINFGYPIIDDDGEIQGVVFAALPLSWLNERAAELKLPSEQTFTIVDRNGTVLAHHPNPGASVGQRLPDSTLLANILAGQEEGTVIASGIDGVERFYAYIPVGGELYGETYIIAGIDTVVVYASANEILTRNLIFLALLGSFILAAAWLLSEHYILRRVNSLMEVTERLAAGDLTARTSLPYGSGELSQLARTLDNMADVLEQRTAEQEAAESALWENEQRLARLFNHLPGMAYRCRNDRQWTMEFVSEGCLELTGYDVEDLVENRTVAYGSLIHPDHRQKVWDQVQIDLQKQRPYLLTYRIHTRNGEEKWAWELGSGVFSDEGEVLALEGFITDITIRHEAEKRIQQNAARAEALAHMATRLNAQLRLNDILSATCEEAALALDFPIAVVFLYDERDATMTNFEVYGVSPKDGRHLKPLCKTISTQLTDWNTMVSVIPDLQSVPDMHIADAPINGEIRTAVIGIMQRNDEIIGSLCLFSMGEVRTLTNDEMTLLKGLTHQAAQAISNARLFAETQRLLRQTREQAQQVQQIIDTLPEGVLLIDKNHHIVLANPVAQEYLPVLVENQVTTVPLTRLGGHPLDEFLHPLQSGAPWLELALPEEDKVFVFATRPIGNEGQETGWVIVLSDVTEERRHREYIQTQERLATVGQLAAGIAHDFNNIMSVIILYTHTLTNVPDHPRRKEYLDTITSQAHHASKLISQVLDFSRASVMERTQLDLLPFVKEMIKLLNRTLPETITISLFAEEGEYLVKADPTRLQQVIMNLSVNARDAMAAGGKLEITLSQMDLTPDEQPPLPEMQPGRWIKLAVTDSGAGIPSDDLSHIFEPFFTTKERGRGTGLGLAQVYGIVKKHEGEIEVKSRVAVEENQPAGTTFTIYLPEMKGLGVEIPNVIESQSAKGKGETILLVEDEVNTKLAVQEILTHLGYRVFSAGTGKEALTLFEAQSESIDIVLSDTIMPEMGGLELFEILREKQPDVKLVLMSGYPPTNEGMGKSEHYQNAWLQKPFSADDLARRVRQILDK